MVIIARTTTARIAIVQHFFIKITTAQQKKLQVLKFEKSVVSKDYKTTVETIEIIGHSVGASNHIFIGYFWDHVVSQI